MLERYSEAAPVIPAGIDMLDAQKLPSCTPRRASPPASQPARPPAHPPTAAATAATPAAHWTRSSLRSATPFSRRSMQTFWSASF
jgi:hypothetical protein